MLLFCPFCVFWCFFGGPFLAIGVLSWCWGCGFRYSSVQVQLSMFSVCESVQFSLIQYKSDVSVCFGTTQSRSVQVSMLRYVSVQVNTFCFITNQYVFGQVNTFEYNAVRDCTNPETSICFSTKIQNTKNELTISTKKTRRLQKQLQACRASVKSPGFPAGRVDPINHLCHLTEGLL